MAPAPPTSPPPQQGFPAVQTGPPPLEGDTLKKLKDAIRDLIVRELEAEVDVERTRQYRQAIKNHWYIQGYQYFKPKLLANGNVTLLGVRSDGREDSIEDYVFNDTLSLARKWGGLLGTKAPNAWAVPFDPQNEADKLSAREANSLIGLFRQDWRADEQQIEIASGNFENGTQLGFVDVVSDGERFGYATQPIMELRPRVMSPPGFACPGCGGFAPDSEQVGFEGTQCPGCGQPLGFQNYQDAEILPAPEIVGSTQIPNSRVAFTVCNVLNVSVPFHFKDLQSAPWLRYQYEEHRSRLLKIYEGDPEAIKVIEYRGGETGAGNYDSMGRQVRLSTATPQATETMGRNMLTWSRWWLTPNVLLMLDQPYRQLAEQHFPDGARVSIIGNHVCALKNDKLSKHWSVFQPEGGKFFWRPAICNTMLGNQDMLNDLMNIAEATVTRANAMTVADPEVFDVKALRQRRANPADIVSAKPGTSGRLKDALQTLQRSELPPALMPLIEIVRRFGQEGTGLMPSVWGGGEGSQTWREAEMKKNQGLQQLLTTWKYMTFGWRDAYRNGILLAAEQLESAGLSAPQENTTGGGADFQAAGGTIDFEMLKAGRFSIEVEEWIPVTFGQVSERVQRFMETPEIAANLPIWHPANIQYTKTLLGIQKYVFPQEFAWGKAMRTIQKLLKEQPVMGFDPATGQPMPEPSIQPDWEDKLDLNVEAVRWWLWSKQSEPSQTQANPMGIENVRAFGKKCAQILMMSAAPPPGPETGLGGPGPPGPGPAAPAAGPPGAEEPKIPQPGPAPL